MNTKAPIETLTTPISSSINQLFGRFVTDYLQDIEAMPSFFGGILEQACCRLVDSHWLIEDNFTEKSPLTPPRITQPLPQFEETFVIDEIINSVKSEGLSPHFHNMIGMFGAINLRLCGTDEQMDKVTSWVDDGLFGHFLMTDRGGPSLANWKTVLHQDKPKQAQVGQNAPENKNANEPGLTLSIDKIHGIEAHQLGFAMVVARQQDRPYPVTVLLPPEQCRLLNSQKVGHAFLDEQLQLGNVNGETDVTADMLLNKGGLGAVNRFLTLVRPRFVKSLMHFVLWLNQNNECDLNSDTHESVQYLIQLCDQLAASTEFSMHSVDKVLALKFASNELLSYLVVSGAVKSIKRQRDLLAFTKMEGSSYRCFYEIYTKQKGARS